MILHYYGEYEDKSYISHLKQCTGSAEVYCRFGDIDTIAELIGWCKSRSCTSVITSSIRILAKLTGKDGERKAPSIDNFAGSFFEREGISIVIIQPLKQLITVNYGIFLATHYISKLLYPEKWPEEVPFTWELIDASNADRIFNLYSSADIIAVDIETFKERLAIRVVGYTAIFLTSSGITTHSSIIPCTDDFNLALIRKFNRELKAPKVLQNGKYDCAYLYRYNAVLYNYIFDTANMFHCWYSELPKDLASLGSFFIRKSMYWKDLAESTDLRTYYEYNCRDTYNTALVACYWFLKAPAWAKENYLKEFPLVFPCHMAEMIGLKRDLNRLIKVRESLFKKIEDSQSRLNKMLGVVINPNSPKQVANLLKGLGCGDIKSSEAEIKEAQFLHPLNERVLEPILEIRGFKKLISTYLRTDEDKKNESSEDGGSKDFQGRILFSLNPHGTDTGRLASREHHFWCGFNIQNIPRDETVKSTISADEGFLLCECDRSQAETRGTAFISGDKKLLEAISSTKKFHAINVQNFFGIPYEDVYDDATKTLKNKELYDLSKRTGHGANYNMGAKVMLSTMGPKNVERARKLLNLNKFWSQVKVCEYLLEKFAITYPGVKVDYYNWVVSTVLKTKKLIGATGWTRYTFGKPDKNKRDLNALVAHAPQSLNAMELNIAYNRVFLEIAINPKFQDNFKLGPQIHDSILFQYREGHEYICEEVKKIMEVPIVVKDIHGVDREMLIPVDVKKGKKYWSELE